MLALVLQFIQKADYKTIRKIQEAVTMRVNHLERLLRLDYEAHA